MKKSYTFIYYSVLFKSEKKEIHSKKPKLQKIYDKCSTALEYFEFSPSDEVVNKILEYADL